MSTDKKEELIDSHVSTSQCNKAISALVKYAAKVAQKKEETELLPGKEENVWLVLSVKKVTPEKKFKPFRIPLAHPIVDPRINPVCLITKDPQREYKDLLESHNIKFINRVVGVAKLRGKFKPFEARRMLLKENGLFLADERVIPLLPGLLGKLFFKAKKQPIPVSLTKKELKKELEQAVSSTYMHQNQGTCTSIKIGTISQSPACILQNLKTALPEIVRRINGSWDNIQTLHIKTNSSTSLPIWSCDLGEEEGGRWHEANVMKNDGMKNVEQDLSSGESGSDEVPVAKTDVKNGKKRAADEKHEPLSKKAKKATEPKAEQTNGSVKPVSALRKPKPPTKQTEEEQLPDAKKERKKNHREVGIDLGSNKLDVVDPSSTSESPAKSSKKSISKPETQSKPEKPTSRGSLSSSKPSLTKEKVKKKRLGHEGLEKKKEKLAKARYGGSIKETVIGKKAKSRL